MYKYKYNTFYIWANRPNVVYWPFLPKKVERYNKNTL